jgi:hypothetical protein
MRRRRNATGAKRKRRQKHNSAGISARTNLKIGGAGERNAQAIVKSLSGEYGRAAQYCDLLEYGGFDDWFLPGKDELNMVLVFFRYQ